MTGLEDTRTSTTDRQLRRGTIGVVGMLFMVIAGTAPLTAMASNFALSIGIGAGIGTLGWILVVAALLFVFTAGYVVLSRHVVNAGAYFAFMAYGLGRTVGAATAFIAGIAYNMATIAMVAATGYFAKVTVSQYLSLDLAWYWYTLAALAVVWAAGHFGVSIAARLATAICIAQFALVGALIIAVLLRRSGSFTLDGLSPDSMFSGNFALTLVFCLLSFASYEAAAIYGEECEAPAKSIRTATYLALGLLVALFFVATWSFIAAFDDVTALAAADPGALVTAAADEYLGEWAGSLIAVCIVLSFLAAATAFHNMAARYHFSLSRAGLLPTRLARIHHRYGTPANATQLQVVLSLSVIALFAVAGLDPLLNLFPTVSGVTSLATIYVMAGCCLSVIVSSLRGTVSGSMWSTRIAPAIAGTGLLIVGGIIVANYEDVTGSDSPYIVAMPLILVVGAAYGAFAIRRSPDIRLENYLTE
ncbi:APC family permease [Actinomadura madurae]|uniref:Amino acid transporter n=1 Tax=Actinomadura madurae TaxID=1993 RepID=A0A1I5SBN4_9ACTN|nr:APC family permease [Actinomadura madurae]SFP68102.1 Amino acid transporter [Actinomadura madurae]